MDRIPAEIWLRVFSHLNTDDILNFLRIANRFPAVDFAGKLYKAPVPKAISDLEREHESFLACERYPGLFRVRNVNAGIKLMPSAVMWVCRHNVNAYVGFDEECLPIRIHLKKTFLKGKKMLTIKSDEPFEFPKVPHVMMYKMVPVLPQYDCVKSVVLHDCNFSMIDLRPLGGCEAVEIVTNYACGDAPPTIYTIPIACLHKVASVVLKGVVAHDLEDFLVSAVAAGTHFEELRLLHGVGVGSPHPFRYECECAGRALAFGKCRVSMLSFKASAFQGLHCKLLDLSGWSCLQTVSWVPHVHGLETLILRSCEIFHVQDLAKVPCLDLRECVYANIRTLTHCKKIILGGVGRVDLSSCVQLEELITHQTPPECWIIPENTLVHDGNRRDLRVHFKRKNDYYARKSHNAFIEWLRMMYGFALE